MNRRPPSLFGEHCEILRWRTLRKTLKRWWGRLEKRRVATESGGSGDETCDKMAATAGDERDGGDRWGNVCGRRTSAIFVWRALRNFAMADFEENVEEMVKTTREAADGDRVRRGRDSDETGNETGGPGDETGNKTEATAGDERDGGDRWGNLYGRRGVRI